MLLRSSQGPPANSFLTDPEDEKPDQVWAGEPWEEVPGRLNNEWQGRGLSQSGLAGLCCNPGTEKTEEEDASSPLASRSS